MADIALDATLVAQAEASSRLGRAIGLVVHVEGESGAAVGARPRGPGRLLIDETKLKIETGDKL